MILAIDTATENASVALARPDGSIAAELTWRAGRNHTMHLHPTLRHVMMLAAIEPKDLTGIVATRGPGSFTGIRIGLATAKGPGAGTRCADRRRADSRRRRVRRNSPGTDGVVCGRRG